MRTGVARLIAVGAVAGALLLGSAPFALAPASGSPSPTPTATPTILPPTTATQTAPPTKNELPVTGVLGGFRPVRLLVLGLGMLAMGAAIFLFHRGRDTEG